MTISRDHFWRNGLRIVSLMATWFVGCGGQTTSPTGLVAPGSSQPKPTTSAIVYKEKANPDTFLKGLKTRGIDVISTKGLDLWAFRFEGMVDRLEVWVDVNESPRPEGQSGKQKFLLSTDEVMAAGTINLAILSPAQTGKDGVRVVLQAVSTDGKSDKTLISRLSPLWYAWPNGRSRAQSGLDFGSKLPIRRRKALKLIGYSASNGEPPHSAQLDFRCRAVEPVEK